MIFLTPTNYVAPNSKKCPTISSSAVQLLLLNVFVFYVCSGTDSPSHTAQTCLIFSLPLHLMAHAFSYAFSRRVDFGRRHGLLTWQAYTVHVIVRERYRIQLLFLLLLFPSLCFIHRHRMTHDIKWFNFFHLFFCTMHTTTEDNDVERQ